MAVAGAVAVPAAAVDEDHDPRGVLPHGQVTVQLDGADLGPS